MELDELKSQLKQKLSTDHTGRSDADIAVLLKKRTGSVLGKLKRSLLIEILCCILVIIVFGYIGIEGWYHSLRIYFSVFALLSFGFLGILIYLLQRITRLGATLLPVKSNLQTISEIIEEFMKRYFQFTMALIPVCFVFAFLLGYYDHEPIPGLDKYALHFKARWESFALIMGYLVVFSVLLFFFTKWYLKKLYGNYVAQLKQCIAELEEQ